MAKFLVNIDMSGNEIQNAVLQPLATAPANPTIGRIYYDTDDKMLKTFDGVNWNAAGAVVSVNGKVGVVVLTQDDVGLGNVDNKSEATIKNDFTGSVASGDDGFVTGDAVNSALSLAYQALRNQIPTPYIASNPKMDGTASPGVTLQYAKGDHVHPTDTSRMAANLKGVANGVAELDSNGKIPLNQIPSSMDDVVVGIMLGTSFYECTYDPDQSKWTPSPSPLSPEAGKLYADYASGKAFTYAGHNTWTQIKGELGETQYTAYRGDRGKTAYDHSQLTSGNPHNVTKSDVGLGNVDNTSDATKKTNFTGLLQDDNNGFVTGEMVYNGFRNVLAYLICHRTGTINTSSTSVTVNTPPLGVFLNAYATIGNSVCVVDIEIGSQSSNPPYETPVTFTVAATPSSAITCHVIAFAPSQAMEHISN